MSPRLSDLFLSSQSDERLLKLARGGQERAFTAIVERYRRELLAFARRLSSDGRAEDLVQQTFLAAFAALRSGTEVQNLRGWLYRILRNTAIRAATRSEASVELGAESIASEPLEAAVDRRALALDVLSAVATLPSGQRDALVGTAIHGRSRASVAGSMGLSEGAVRQLTYRARVAVRSAVTAITPLPLVRWLGAARIPRTSDGVSEMVAGTGTASAGGIVLKLGAVAASGVLATGVASSQLMAHHPRDRGRAHPNAQLAGTTGVGGASGGPGFASAQPGATAANRPSRSVDSSEPTGRRSHRGSPGFVGSSGNSDSSGGDRGPGGSDGGGGSGLLGANGGSGGDGGQPSGGGGSDGGPPATSVSTTSSGSGDNGASGTPTSGGGGDTSNASSGTDGGGTLGGSAKDGGAGSDAGGGSGSGVPALSSSDGSALNSSAH